ncbi:MAG TPA: hypothetical protein VFO16_07335 [Pseudonocardiaceae bacterium]|nr:hypothetical protein [Pseudonocardiaceae bacterium]
MTVPVEAAGRPWWKRAWAWGAIAAIVLAVVPPMVDSDIKLQVSIVVVLVGWVITAAVEQYLQIDAAQQMLGGQVRRLGEKVEETRLQVDALTDAMVRLVPVANASPQCQAFVAEVAGHWSAIEDQDHQFFRRIMDAYHREVAQFMSDLADGEAKIATGKFYSFHSLPLDQIRELSMVHVNGLAYWSSQPGRKYLARQAEQIKTGKLTVRRIFVLDDLMAEPAREIITAQARAGINVRIAKRGNLPPEARRHVIDQGVVTDTNGEKMLVQSVPQAEDEQLPSREWLFYRQDQVADAEYSFTTLWEDHGDEIKNIYPELADLDVSLSPVEG